MLKFFEVLLSDPFVNCPGNKEKLMTLTPSTMT